MLLLALAACSRGPAGSATAAHTDRALLLHGATPTLHDPRPSFTLLDTTGREFSFQARTRGEVTLLYFGYTHCPDQCPTAMADIASALRQVPSAVARRVSVVFVTTDPWRDTRRRLRQWLDRLSATFVGLIGTPAQVAGAEVTTGMPLSRKQLAPKSYGSGAYAVNHFAAVVAYGRDDRVATFYPSGVGPGDIAADLRVLVNA